MWIFHKRDFSVSKEFELCLVEEKDDSLNGQVDRGYSIYKWYLVGFWADVEEKYFLGVLSCLIKLLEIHSSKNLHVIKHCFQISN